MDAPKKVFYFALNFFPWELLLIKKLDFEKTKVTLLTTFKTDIIKVVLVFLISNFSINKNSQERKYVREKRYKLLQIWLYFKDIFLMLLLENQI